jgi:hypothetical protein
MVKMFMLLATTLLLLASCGSPGGGDWLVRTDKDTLTVREAGEAWTTLAQENRAVFLENDEPALSFLRALGRKLILNRELDASGIPGSARIRVYQRAWARSALFLALSDSLPAFLARECGDEDIRFFREHMGRTVWYTDLSTGSSMGPVHLPELPRDLALTLSEASRGEIVSCGSGTFMLDSMLATDSTLLAESLADTAYVNRLAVSRLSSSEATRTIRQAESLARAGMTVDTSLVILLAGGGEPASGDTVMRSRLLTLDPEDLRWEISFSSLGTPVSPDSPDWLFYFLGNLVRLEAGAELFRQRWPEESGEILREAGAFAREAALEVLYDQEVSASVTVTDSMIEEEFESLEEPLLLPQRRVLEMGYAPTDMTGEVRSALAAGDRNELRRLLRPYSSYEGFDTGSLVSGPVTADRVPEAMGGIVFSADPQDTLTWYGPMETQMGSMMVYRTVRVLPGEPASLQDAREWLEARIRARLEEQELRAWIDALEREASLEINLDLLGRLPADPALWLDL